MHLDAIDSYRMRGGARFNYKLNEYVTSYVGVAYEHEFVGLTIKPSEESQWLIDIGVQGYIGQREGIGGSLRVGFEF